MRLRNKKGFTLIEVMVVVLLIGLVISMAFSMLFFGYNVFGLTSQEFDVQSNMRLAMEEINTMVRSSKALFAVPDATYRDEQWNYIAVSEDNTMTLNYQWDSTIDDHVVTVLVGPYDDVLFDISFFKDDSLSKDNTVKMRLEATVHGSTKRFDILTGYEALNSLQVIDYGTEANPAKALAYRGDEFHYENLKIYVNIALVLDTSGSMTWNLSGNTTSTRSSRRIAILKTQSKNLIDQLAQNTNSDVIITTSLVEYNTTANNPGSFLNVKTSRTQIKNEIDELCNGSDQSCSGGTNIGDGLRRAYHLLEARTTEIDNSVNLALEEYIVKNYLIVLTDGDYTFYSRQIVPSGSNRNIVVCSAYSNTSANTCPSNRRTTYSISIPTTSFYLGSQNVTGTGVNYYELTTYYRSNGRKNYDEIDFEYNVQSKSYVSDNAVESGFYGNGTYAFGHGANLDPVGLEYIQAVSNLGLNNNEDYTNYIIRFTSGASQTAINNLQAALNVDSTRMFSASNENELGMSFTNIQTSITNDTWHYLGPRLSD